MAKKVQALTPGQIAAQPEYVRKWTAVGLSTQPADRARAEAAIRQAYTLAGLAEPEHIVWCGSPMALCAGALPEDPELPACYPHSCLYGQHDASWLGLYDYYAAEIGLTEETAQLRGLIDYAQAAGWARLYERVAYLAERPCLLSRDAQGRLHSLTGPSVRYPDGWSLYHVRGTPVPAEWIEQRDALDPLLALNEPNLERRAAAASIIGWTRVLQHLQPRVIDERPHSVERALEMARAGGYDYGRLLEVQLPSEGAARFLEVICPAHIGETRVLRVPPTISTAKEANAWTYRRDAASFAPEGRS